MRVFAAALVAALALSACQEPAGVGIGLLDEEQSSPTTRTVLLTDLDTLQRQTVAIGIADPDNAASQQRVLAGSVADDAFGDARAVAYVDARPTAVPDDAEADDVSEAWLVLRRTYVYGDTTTALPLTLREVQGEWEVDTSYPADTLFDVGPVLSTTTVSVADTLVRFDLPPDWVAANAATLIGDDFGDDFEGFALQVPDGYVPAPGAVFGFGTFESTGSGLRVVVDEDTLAFDLSEVFTSISTDPPAVRPTDYVAVRANSNASLRFDADFSGVGPSAVASALIRLPLAPSLEEAGTFVRPFLERGLLAGVRDRDDGETSTVILGELGIARSGDAALLTDSRELTARVQALLIDPEGAGFDRFRVLPASNPVSLDVLPVLLTGDASGARFTLTLVGGSVDD